MVFKSPPIPPLHPTHLPAGLKNYLKIPEIQPCEANRLLRLLLLIQDGQL